MGLRKSDLFVFVLEMGPPMLCTLAQNFWDQGILPSQPPQVAGTTGVCHCTWLISNLNSSSEEKKN